MRNHNRRSGVAFALALAAIVLLGAFVRFYGLNWDAGTHLHPDERYLTMVVSAVRFPSESTSLEGGGGCDGFRSCLALYWDTERSPLNPSNYEQFANYVYGTLPLFTTRGVARWVDGACSMTPRQLPDLYRAVLLGAKAPCVPGTYTGYSGIHLVGRSLSAFADLLSLVGLALLARALYGDRTALVAGLLYAFAVLPVQHAHFFVVDSFATVFVVWTLLLSVLAFLRRRPAWIIGAGLLSGLAIASKVSVWPLVGIVGLAGVLDSGISPPTSDDTTQAARRRLYLNITLSRLLALALAGVCAAVAFRATQPYAFAGPGFLDVRLNPSWLDTMRNIRDLMRGVQDVPYGHQWTERTPILFPWRNMVFWGLGLPLGLAAWLGWAWMGWKLGRGRHRHLLIWLWGTGFFLYQATQWVKSMRYLLPVYPVFVLFAAWAVWKLRMDKTHRAFLRRLAGALPILLILATTLWCVAFLAIYQRPLTRVAASEWLYDNVPTAVVLETPSGPVNVPWSPSLTLTDETPVASTQYRVEHETIVTAVRMPEVVGEVVVAERTLVLTVGEQHLTQRIHPPNLDSVEMVWPLDPPLTLTADDVIPLSVTLADGPPVTVNSATIANEHWDDPLPLRIGGRDGFWNWFLGLTSSPTGQMNNYDEDTVQKRYGLLAWLSEADYIVLSSNRLYASIPRLAQRYPLTTEYYRQLLNGNLGFDLAAEFVSYPRLGPCQFPDQEIPFKLMAPETTTAAPCSVPMPPAEEAFSVYDHPTVLIFEKTEDYSPIVAETLLPISLINEVRWMTPREATRARAPKDNSDALLLSPKMRRIQEAGGTWSRMFNTEALQNRNQRVAIVVWALLVTLLGWIAFPFVSLAFPALRCRGYGLSRAVGVLAWAYIAWLLASLRVLPYTRLVLWGIVVVMAGAAAWLAQRNWAELQTLIRTHWRSMLTVDLIFLTLFLAWVGVRWMNPDLWHPVVGGEKPMDFAYYNAVMKSTWFPPYDPWFAGGRLNYYYFGFVMMGSLTKALGIVPNIAYNLAIPTLFALTGVGGYVLGSNLAGGDARRWRRAGLWGVATVVILGNLGEVQLLAEGLVDVGNVDFESLIPKYPEAVSLVVGLWKVVVKGVSLSFRPEWWYWDPTRMIPVQPGEVGPINEFPAFTFLYADLHAHAMALPLTQVALALALQWALGTAQAVRTGLRGWRANLGWALPRPAGSLLLAGLVAGALRATNTWDYPTYLALMSVGFVTGLVVSRTRGRHPGLHWDRQMLWGTATPLLLLACAELLFRPFTTNYLVPYAAFELWSGSRTPLKTYLLMYGPWLFPIVVGAVTGVVRWIAISVAPGRAGISPTARTPGGAVGAPLVGAHGERPTELQSPSDDERSGTSPAPTDDLGSRRVAQDSEMSPSGENSTSLLTSPWLEAALWIGIVGLLGAVLIVFLVVYFQAPVAWLGVSLGLAAAGLVIGRGVPLRHRIFWFWVGTALALSILVEVAVLKGDIGRMNTVFKFYLQVWMLLAVTGAVFIERFLHSPNGLRDLLLSPGFREHPEPTPQMKSAPPSATASGPQAAPGSTTGPLGKALRHNKVMRSLSLASDVVAIVMAILLLGAALYPTFAIPARFRDRWVPSAPHTLDGMAFMRSAVQYERDTEIHTVDDYRVIRWLQENVQGSPTIIEAQADREYLWGNRISIYTGLPTVVAWRWHQVQQRMVMPSGTVEARQQDVRRFYNTTDPQVAYAILTKYQVSYVILTPYELAYTLPEGLEKFDEMVRNGWLEVVYQDEASTVYRVVPS